MVKIKNYFVFCLLTCSMIFVFPACTAQIMSDKKISDTPVMKNENKTIVNEVNPSKEEQEVQEPKKEISVITAPGNAKKDKEDEQEEEQDLMERALDLMDEADIYWEKGDVENTLNILDKAYALILDTNGYSAIARQKDDLRLLISKRILAVYSARQSLTNGKASEIPLIMNPDVEKEIRLFQGIERDFFITSYQRSGLYRSIIIKELKKAGIPEELFWLPLVESGFKIQAYSRAHALGLWQFIPSTGYKFGLNRDEWIDERMDVEKSTEAAIAYLKELHDMFGDWLTVLAAYNCGEGKVLRVMSRQRINYFDRFWDLYNQLPRETSRYVPRFLATLHIIKNPQKYGFNLDNGVEKPVPYSKVKVDKIMKLRDIASKIEVSEDVLNVLNSELRHKLTPDTEYDLKIPTDALAKFNLIANEIPESEKPIFSARAIFKKHRIKHGETVASIAKRYKISKAALISNNPRTTKNGLYAGQMLRIPIIREERLTKNKTKSINKRIQTASVGSRQLYKVKRGDTLFSISRRFDIPADEIKEINKLSSNSIQVGRVLKLYRAETVKSFEENNGENNNPAEMDKNTKIINQTLSAADVDRLGTNKYIVTKGDNLSLIAQKNNTSSAKIMKLNNISSDETLIPGQIIIIR
jgi:membrane-bound lytic murein transglycosylase D